MVPKGPTLPAKWGLGARLVSAIPECPNWLDPKRGWVVAGPQAYGRESRAGGEYALYWVLRDDPVRKSADDGCRAV
jgi:hypothetical protein